MQTEEFASQNAGPTAVRSRHSGFALLGLLGAMLVVALLAAGLLVLFNTQLLQTSESALASRAFQSAETGLSLGKAYISTNLFWYTNALPRTMVGTNGQSMFSIVITTNSAGMARITSTGDQDPTEWTSIWEDLAGNYIGSGGRGRLLQGIVVYRDNVTAPTNRPRWRAYTRFQDVSDEQMALTNSTTLRWQRLAAHPTTNAFLLVSQDASGRIYAQACTGNTWFALTNLNSIRAITTTNRAFDVTYENLSGDGLVVYSTNGIIAQYRTWNGATWSTPSNAIATNGTIRWVRLVPKPNSDEIMLLARWRNALNTSNFSSAVVWNGSRWASTQALETACGGSSFTNETMDAAYSSTTGIVVYVNGSNTVAGRQTPKYRTWNGAAWSAETSFAPGALPSGGYPYWIRVEFNTNGTDAFAAILDSSNRLVGSHWTAGAWGAYNTFGTAGGVRLATNTCRPFDVAWSEQTNALMVVYATNNATTRSYVFQQGSGAAVTGTTADVASQGRWLVLKAAPFAPEFVYVGLDDQNDVSVQRYDGSAWIPVGEVETNSNTNYCSIDMAFRNDTNAIPIP